MLLRTLKRKPSKAVCERTKKGKPFVTFLSVFRNFLSIYGIARAFLVYKFIFHFCQNQVHHGHDDQG